MKKMILEVDLVPDTSHFKNLRSELKAAQWDYLRKQTYAKAGHKCEICGGRGRKWPVECHEIWEYKDGIQKLTGLIALCPDCHQSKHIGLAKIKGRGDYALKHIAKVNGISKTEAEQHVAESFEEWRERSNVKWELDISLAHKMLEAKRG